MAIVTVKVRDNGTFLYLKNLPKRARRISKRQGWNLTQMGARLMKEAAIEKGIRNWKRLLMSKTGIQPIKISEATYGIAFPGYGIALDRMRPHWVNLSRGRPITAWARSKGIKAKKIQVSPHPYIRLGYRRMLRKADMITKRTAEQIVR